MYLIENPAAKELHQQAKRAELAGNFRDAWLLYDDARGALGLRDEDTPVTTDSNVQYSRIIRDGSFNRLRLAMVHGGDADQEELVGWGLQTAASLTKAAIDALGTEKLPFVLEEQFDANPSLRQASMQELLAEHGATLGLLGRLATAREVMHTIDPRGDGATARYERTEKQKYYGKDYAHGILKQGNNGCYLVSNAMNGARQEIINGQRLRAGKWVGRAVTGLAWTAQHDRRNFATARDTILGRLPSLRNYQAAKDSVLVKP